MTTSASATQTRTDLGAPPTLVVGFDFSTASIHALDRALDLATNWPQTKVIAVAADASAHTSDDGHDGRQAAEALLERLGGIVQERAERRRANAKSSDVDLRLRVTDAPATDALRRIAYLEGADMIVVGAASSSRIGGAVFGSVPMDLSREAPCSVLVCQTKADASLPKIEPPPQPGQGSALKGRHTYHYESRVGQPRVNMPLLFPMEE